MGLEEAAELALCADKYNIQRLVGKAAKRLKPTTAEDVFAALMCVAYINCAELEYQVNKVIQENTDKICQNQKFLELDENCLLFIVKQSSMNINELQLWNNIIRWGENQVNIQPKKTLRDCLNKVLQHVRLLSLTSNEILDHVLPEKVLTSEEFMDLTLAVSRKQPLQSLGLSKIQEKRGKVNNFSNGGSEESFSYYSESCYNLTQLDSKPCSTLTIKPARNVKINTLTLRSIQTEPNNDYSFKPYRLTCNIAIYKSSSGHLVQTESLELQASAVPNEQIVLEVNKNACKPLILEAEHTYNWLIGTSPPLPVHTMFKGKQKINTTSAARFYHPHTEQYFTVKFEDPFHVLEIGYSIL